MKPYYFVEDVIKQLEGFKVSTVDFELHVGGDGYVGSGNSVLRFSIDINDYKVREKKKMDKMFEDMLGAEGGQDNDH